MINYRGFTLNQPGTQAPWGKIEFDLFKSMIDTMLDTTQPWTTVYNGPWIDSIPSANAMTYGVTQNDKPTGTAWVRVTTSEGEFVGVCNPNNTFSKFGNATYDDECNTLFSTTFKDVADNVLEGFGYITHDLDDQNNSTYLALVKAGDMTEDIKIEFLSSSSVLFTTVTPSVNYTTLSSISVRGNDSFKPASFYSLQQAINAPDQNNIFSSAAELQTLLDDGYTTVYASPNGSVTGSITIPFGLDLHIKGITSTGLLLNNDLTINFGSGIGYVGSLKIDALTINEYTLTIDNRIGPSGPALEIENINNADLGSTISSSGGIPGVKVGKIVGPVSTHPMVLDSVSLTYEESNVPFTLLNSGVSEKQYWRTPTTLDNTCSSTAEMQALIDAGFEEVFASGDGSFSGTLNIPFGSNVKIKSSSVIGLVMTGDFSVLLGSGTGYWGSVEFDFVRTGGNTLTLDSQYQNVRIKKLKVEGNSTLASSTTLGDIWINKITGTDTLTVEDTNLHYEEIVGPVIATTGVGTAVQVFWWTPTTPFTEVTSEGDDKGLVFTEQISVGKSGDGREAAFGEGDSVPMNYAFHCTRANTTGDTIVNAVDITDILSSDTGSTTGLFGGTATGNYILVGFDQQFQGVKIKSTDCGNVESDNVELASWRAGGNKFPVRFMNTNSNFPYTQYGNQVCVTANEQWRFGFDPTTPSTWVQNTLNINGTDITQYWGIFEVITPITQDATIEQMKVHTNRCEVNSDGKIEYFGLARYPRTLQYGLINSVPNAVYNPPNQNVAFGTNFTAVYTDNQLTDNAIDGFGLVQSVVSGLDTSIPLQLILSYYVNGAATGDIKFNVDVFQVNDGFVYNGLNTPQSFSVIDTVSSPSNLVRRSKTILIGAESLTDDGDSLVISVYRDATAGEPEDTLSANVIMTNVTIKGYFWGP